MSIEKLKEKFKKFTYNKINKAIGEKKEFDGKFSLTKLENMKLDEYTNLIDNLKDDEDYFTHFIETKTKNCGSFSAGNASAYGIYRIKNNDKYKFNKEEFDKTEAKKIFENEIRQKIVDIANYEDIDNISPLYVNFARKVAYMYKPDKLIPIFKRDVIKSIGDFFDVDIDINSYKATEEILKKITEVWELEKIDIETTLTLGAFLWEYFGKQISFEDKNIIYYGAPGVGKTYTLLNAIEQRCEITGDEYEIVQFHPNYSYEDFIDGVKPVGFENGNLKLELVDGIFKELCKKAFKELAEKEKPKNFYLLIDEINRANLSAVFGEILSCIEEDKRLKFEDGKLKGLRLKTSNSNLWKNDNAVVIDEKGKRLFGVPENLYILATMNDIDRSIDSFDLALRRRFKWIRKTIDYDVITETLLEKGIDDNELENYIDSIKSLNEYISKTLGLGESYELGHSYFMNVNVRGRKISKSEKERIFNQEIEPLLREYLRSEYDEEESEKKLKKAKEIFIGENNGEKSNTDTNG
jgi:hypothetical protein